MLQQSEYEAKQLCAALQQCAAVGACTVASAEEDDACGPVRGWRRRPARTSRWTTTWRSSSTWNSGDEETLQPSARARREEERRHPGARAGRGRGARRDEPADVAADEARRSAALQSAARRGHGHHAAGACLDAGCWHDASRNPERRGALLRQLETGRYVEFEALDNAGNRRGLVLAEVIGIKELASSKLEVIVVEPVAAEQEPVLEWSKEHLTTPVALFVASGRRLADYESICDGEDFVVMVVARSRQVTRAAAEASWAGAALALHRAAAERERPPRRATVAPPADEELGGDPATSGELRGAMRGGEATMDAVEDLRRRVCSPCS